MVSHKLKFIFIHIPKTGGNSLTMFLRSSLANKVTISGNEDVDVFCEVNKDLHTRPLFPMKKLPIKHENIEYYHKLYGEKIKDYYKFAIVRNPYDLIMSLHFYNNRNKSEFNKNEFIRYVKDDLNLFTQKGSKQWHITPDVMQFRQYRFVTYKDKIDCNIIRYENFMEDLKQIECLKSYNFNNYPKINSRKHAHKNRYVACGDHSDIPQYASYYDEQLSELVYNKFKEDFDVFNYKKYNP